MTVTASGATYLPPYYEGTPLSAGVTGVDPPDYSGKETFRSGGKKTSLH